MCHGKKIDAGEDNQSGNQENAQEAPLGRDSNYKKNKQQAASNRAEFLKQLHATHDLLHYARREALYSGGQLGTLTVQRVAHDVLSIPAATLRDQFRVRNGDLFNVPEIQAGLERLTRLYRTHGYADVKGEPHTEVDNASHRIDLILRITEGPQTP